TLIDQPLLSWYDHSWIMMRNPLIQAIVADSAVAPQQRRSAGVSSLQRSFYGRVEPPQLRYRRMLQQECEGAKSILDIGCGYDAPDLERVGSNAHIKIGVDLITKFRPDEAPSVKFVRANAGCLPFCDSSFDLVISKSVVEHLGEPSRVFGEVSRVLRPGGRFVFLTANWFDYVSLFAAVIPNRWHPRIVRFLTGRNEADTFPTYYRANTTNRIMQFCNRAGLEIDWIRLLREDPGYLRFSTLTYALSVLYEQTAARFVRQLRPWILCVCTHNPIPKT
ncbi:MAG: methyltransferase domain-containing protein, partial [Planctomycetaceae bacterium]